MELRINQCDWCDSDDTECATNNCGDDICKSCVAKVSNLFTPTKTNMTSYTVRVGDRVRLNTGLEGEIGCRHEDIAANRSVFFFKRGVREGMTCSVHNTEYTFDTPEIIEIITMATEPKKNYMTKITEFFNNMTLDADTKLLREMGLEDTAGNATETGYTLSQEITYKANRAAIITIAQAMKDEAAKK